ncbi:hypothetical protein [Endozoicomonas arenosclerae]|uniref:hypothetical protein n=1 Tax=Endozoicomonas arenosclerae TaxID=1633495 RepID=UPI000780A317|nr:hypothetical protein [Endozoicomonas arenosclerae]
MIIKRQGHRYIDVESGKTLDAWFPEAILEPVRSCLAEKYGVVRGEAFELEIDTEQEGPVSTEDAYLRLHLLSECSVQPNQINLEGLFGVLPNIAWTSAGPVLPETVNRLRSLVSQEHHHLQVSSIDKFPRMSDYVIPAGVRIADADRVRLGACRT